MDIEDLRSGQVSSDTETREVQNRVNDILAYHWSLEQLEYP